MEMASLIPILENLKKTGRRVIFTSRKGVKVTATYTGKFSEDDFAVGLKFPGRDEFYPTHVRLLFDLYLKRLSNLDGAQKVFCVLEHVFEGRDPDVFGPELGSLDFPMSLDEPAVTVHYAQLLMIEQDFNRVPEREFEKHEEFYTKKRKKPSKHDPPREYLMGFIRWIASGEEEIDKVITGAVRNWPPPKKFTPSLKSD